MLMRAFMGAVLPAVMLALCAAGGLGGGRLDNAAGPAAFWWDLRHAAGRVVCVGG